MTTTKDIVWLTFKEFDDRFLTVWTRQGIGFQLDEKGKCVARFVLTSIKEIL